MKEEKITQTTSRSESGAILPMVIILMLALMMTGMAFLNAGIMENGLVRREIAKTQSFYLAESGIERLSVKLYAGGHWSIKSQDLEGGGQDGSYRPAVQVTSLGEGQYWVEYYDGNPPYLSLIHI